MPPDLREKFENEYNLNPDHVKNQLYRTPGPNSYLATFAKFLIENRTDTFCRTLIENGIGAFVDKQVKQFSNHSTKEVHFVGSLAYYLREDIAAVLKDSGYDLGKTVRKNHRWFG